MNINLHSLSRRLIELRIEHGELDGRVDHAVLLHADDALMLRRLKKRRLVLKDQNSRLQAELEAPQPA